MINQFTPTNVKNSTCNGKCSCCGSCCTEFIPWTLEEIKRVKDYLLEHPEIKEQYAEAKPEGFHIVCAFRDETTHKCLVYPVRPWICRHFMCSQPLSTMENNKCKAHSRKDCINKIVEDPGVPLGMINLCSTHRLFFNNVNWDIEFAYRVLSPYIEDKDKLDRSVKQLLESYFVTVEED